MNDPDPTDLLEDLEAEFLADIAAGSTRAVDYLIKAAEHVAPLWAAAELPKRLAAIAEMVAEWREEAA